MLTKKDNKKVFNKKGIYQTFNNLKIDSNVLLI